MKVNASVDERLDPLRATEGAARFLKENYELLGSWPLAITAYNHGPGGMARARQRHGVDMPEIIENYESRTFGFASKNFYAEFLAAMDIARDPEKYLGVLEMEPPLEFETIRPDRTYGAAQLTRVSGVSKETLRAYNPHVLPAVWNGSRSLPAGTTLRVPSGKGVLMASAASVKVSTNAAKEEAPAPRPRAQAVATVSAETYRIRPGDTLIGIAQRHGVSLAELQRVNNIRDPQQIRAGEVLHFTESTEAAPSRYKVRRGDTLSAIARRIGVSLEAILQLNEIGRGHNIYPGQILLLPSGF
jgi:membrane-bound lytic murein transglycosylase D